MTVLKRNEATRSSADARHVLVHGVTLSLLCVASYWLITHILQHVFSISRDDDLLGGMWAVVATIFVYRFSHEQSAGAALSRIGATSLSFALCFIYLLFFPFHVWGLAALIGVGAIAMSLTRAAGRRYYYRNHNRGRDGRRRHKPESRVDAAHPAHGRHHCWSRRWSRWRVAQLEVRRPRERSGLRTDDTSYAKTIRKLVIYCGLRCFSL
jgi:hypothetical protein